MVSFLNNNLRLISFSFYSTMILFNVQTTSLLLQVRNAFLVLQVKFSLWTLLNVRDVLMGPFSIPLFMFVKLKLIRTVLETKFTTKKVNCANVLLACHTLMAKFVWVALFLNFGIQKIKNAKLVHLEITIL